MSWHWEGFNCSFQSAVEAFGALSVEARSQLSAREVRHALMEYWTSTSSPTRQVSPVVPFSYSRHSATQ